MLQIPTGRNACSAAGGTNDSKKSQKIIILGERKSKSLKDKEEAQPQGGVPKKNPGQKPPKLSSGENSGENYEGNLGQSILIVLWISSQNSVMSGE